MLGERNNHVLGAAIREYIRTGHPVASRELASRYRLHISPATVRSSMLELDDLGYLEQPHTSAGRVPTDQGYRYFVDYLIPNAVLAAHEESLLEQVFAIDDEEEFLCSFGRTLAELTGAFTATGSAEREFWYKTGLSGVLGEPELYSEEGMRLFGHLADDIEENITNLVESLAEDENVEQTFIGGENPLRGARFCSMMVSSWHHPRGFDGLVVMVAPRRTNYEKHVAVLRRLKEQN